MAKNWLVANLVFAISQFFAVRFLEADGKELLCRPLADGKELAYGKVADSSRVRYTFRGNNLKSTVSSLLEKFQRLLLEVLNFLFLLSRKNMILLFMHIPVEVT